MNNINMSSTNRIEVLEKKIIDLIEEEDSKLNLQIPFRTDTESDRAFKVNNILMLYQFQTSLILKSIECVGSRSRSSQLTS